MLRSSDPQLLWWIHREVCGVFCGDSGWGLVQVTVCSVPEPEPGAAAALALLAAAGLGLRRRR